MKKQTQKEIVLNQLYKKGYKSKEEKNWVYVLAPHYQRVGKDLCFIK